MIVKGVLILLGLIPLPVRILMGRSLGYFFGLIPTRDSKIAKLQLQQILKHPCPKSVIPKIYASIGQTLFESLNLAPYLRNSKRVYCPDQELVREYIEKDVPIVALTAHTANWDLLAAYMIQQGVKLSTVGRRARSKTLQNILEHIRDGYGIKTLWREKGSGTKIIVTELKERRTVSALIDQDTRVSSVFSPLLGVQARTPSGIVVLGKRCDAEFVTAFITRTGFMSYRIDIKPFDKSMSLEEIIDEYNQRLGKILTNHPEQWVWFHKRWRSHPTLGTLTSQKYVEYLETKKAGNE